MKKCFFVAISVLLIISFIMVPAGANDNVIVSDSPVFIGAWRGAGDLTGNITETGMEVFGVFSGENELSLMRDDIVSVNLPDGAYSFENSDEAIIVLKESYLKERENGYNCFTVCFDDIRVEVTYFVVKDKTDDGYRFNGCLNSEGSAVVTLTGIPATAPCLLTGVRMDGEKIADCVGIRLVTWCNVITVIVGQDAIPRDRQPHEFRLTFENLDSVIITVYPCQMGDVNGDSDIDAEDARLALRASAGLEWLTDAAFTAADIDNNGVITASEARTILRVGAKLESF